MVLWIIANFKTGFLKNDKHKKGFIIHILCREYLNDILKLMTKYESINYSIYSNRRNCGSENYFFIDLCWKFCKITGKKVC